MKLSETQIDALYAFAQAGGHGFGEYAYLSKATAHSLARKGLVKLGSRPGSVHSGRRIQWGIVTPEGLQALREVSSLGPSPENSSIEHPPYGWYEWPSSS